MPIKAAVCKSHFLPQSSLQVLRNIIPLKNVLKPARSCLRSESRNRRVALLYLRFALWLLDLKLLSGPDALKKGRVAGFHIISSLFNELNKDVICKPFLKASR